MLAFVESFMCISGIFQKLWNDLSPSFSFESLSSGTNHQFWHVYLFSLWRRTDLHVNEISPASSHMLIFVRVFSGCTPLPMLLNMLFNTLYLKGQKFTRLLKFRKDTWGVCFKILECKPAHENYRIEAQVIKKSHWRTFIIELDFGSMNRLLISELQTFPKNAHGKI